VGIERVIAVDDPQSAAAHCLRAAIIVRADDIGARSSLGLKPDRSFVQ